jgi:hypothetical protein
VFPTSETDLNIIRGVQARCADIHEFAEGKWTEDDGEFIASLLNQSEEPWALFRFMDEKTGDYRVGYNTRDGREWFYVLRQMRNTPGSGLFENLKPRYS